MSAHPYREPAEAPKQPHWCVITEPSIFRAEASRIRGPFTKEQAERFARRWVAVNPHGEAQVCRPRTWPPVTNREPLRLYDDATDNVYRE